MAIKNRNKNKSKPKGKNTNKGKEGKDSGDEVKNLDVLHKVVLPFDELYNLALQNNRKAQKDDKEKEAKKGQDEDSGSDMLHDSVHSRLEAQDAEAPKSRKYLGPLWNRMYPLLAYPDHVFGGVYREFEIWPLEKSPDEKPKEWMEIYRNPDDGCLWLIHNTEDEYFETIPSNHMLLDRRKSGKESEPNEWVAVPFVGVPLALHPVRMSLLKWYLIRLLKDKHLWSLIDLRLSKQEKYRTQWVDIQIFKKSFSEPVMSWLKLLAKLKSLQRLINNTGDVAIWTAVVTCIVLRDMPFPALDALMLKRDYGPDMHHDRWVEYVVNAKEESAVFYYLMEQGHSEYGSSITWAFDTIRPATLDPARQKLLMSKSVDGKNVLEVRVKDFFERLNSTEDKEYQAVSSDSGRSLGQPTMGEETLENSKKLNKKPSSPEPEESSRSAHEQRPRFGFGKLASALVNKALKLTMAATEQGFAMAFGENSKNKVDEDQRKDSLLEEVDGEFEKIDIDESGMQKPDVILAEESRPEIVTSVSDESREETNITISDKSEQGANTPTSTTLSDDNVTQEDDNASQKDDNTSERADDTSQKDDRPTAGKRKKKREKSKSGKGKQEANKPSSDKGKQKPADRSEFNFDIQKIVAETWLNTSSMVGEINICINEEQKWWERVAGESSKVLNQIRQLRKTEDAESNPNLETYTSNIVASLVKLRKFRAKFDEYDQFQKDIRSAEWYKLHGHEGRDHVVDSCADCIATTHKRNKTEVEMWRLYQDLLYSECRCPRHGSRRSQVGES